MPRGGRRVGAGRKPAGTVQAIVLGMDGQRREPTVMPTVTPEERVALAEPPSDLQEYAKNYWRQQAPKAIEAGTLKPSTEEGFRELCERRAIVAAIDARILLLGVATQDALPYLKERRGQAAQLNTSLKDFKLTAFGKPVDTGKPKAAVNPFAQFSTGS